MNESNGRFLYTKTIPRAKSLILLPPHLISIEIDGDKRAKGQHQLVPFFTPFFQHSFLSLSFYNSAAVYLARQKLEWVGILTFEEGLIIVVMIYLFLGSRSTSPPPRCPLALSIYRAQNVMSWG